MTELYVAGVSILAGALVAGPLGITHFIKAPGWGPVRCYIYGSGWCLAALEAVLWFISFRPELLLPAPLIWATAGVVVAGIYKMDDSRSAARNRELERRELEMYRRAQENHGKGI